MRLVIIKPRCEEEKGALRLNKILQKSLDTAMPDEGGSRPETEQISTAEELKHRLGAPGQLRGRRILFAVSLGEWGMNLEMYAMIRCIRKNPRCMEHSIAGILTDGGCELYTKSAAAELVFAANLSGCLFIGQPLVEGTKSLKIFRSGRRTCAWICRRPIRNPRSSWSEGCWSFGCRRRESCGSYVSMPAIMRRPIPFLCGVWPETGWKVHAASGRSPLETEKSMTARDALTRRAFTMGRDRSASMEARL